MGKIKSIIYEQKTELRELLYNYTLTLIAGGILSVLYVIMDMANVNDEAILSHIYTIICVFIVGAFVIETFIEKKKDKNSIIIISLMYILNLFIAIVTDVVFYNLDKLTDKTEYLVEAYFITFYSVLMCLAFYKIIKKNQIIVEKYFARALFGLLRIWGLFFLLWAACILILEIFDSLIIRINYWEYLSRIETLLAGFLFFPFSVMTVTDTREDNSKFTKGLLKYALMPCVLISTIIIYIYILKIIIIGEIPSNKVFRICAELFVIGGPIWLMANAFIEENAKLKNKQPGMYGKIVKNMAYIYIPCIILEIICIGMRIGQYGFTETRYLAVMFIIFQIIYVAWKHIMKLLKKDEGYEGLILVFMGMFIIGAIAPFINAQKISCTSQKNRFEKAMEENDLNTAIQAYNYLDVSAYGSTYLKENYSAFEIKEIENTFSEYIDILDEDEKDALYNETIYVDSYNGSLLINGLDISGYKNIYSVKYSMRENISAEELTNLEIEYNHNKNITMDLTDCVEHYKEQYDADETEDIYEIVIDENTKLVIYSISFKYEKYKTELIYLQFNGYLLTK